MDLNGCPRSDLSLGLHGAPYAPIVEDSISFPNDPALREPPGSTTSLHLFDDQSKYARASANARTPTDVSDGADMKNGDEEEQKEEISILGYTMSIKKRRRRGDSSSSSCSSSHPSKRPTKLESQPAAVRSWGNGPLSIADPNVFAIM